MSTITTSREQHIKECKQEALADLKINKKVEDVKSHFINRLKQHPEVANNKSIHDLYLSGDSKESLKQRINKFS